MDTAEIRRRTSSRVLRCIPDASGVPTTVATTPGPLTSSHHVRSQGFPRRADGGAREGRYLGIGFSTYTEACSIAPSKPWARSRRAGLYDRRSGFTRTGGAPSTRAALTGRAMSIDLRAARWPTGGNPRPSRSRSSTAVHGSDPVRAWGRMAAVRPQSRHCAPHIDEQVKEKEEDRGRSPRGIGGGHRVHDGQFHVRGASGVGPVRRGRPTAYVATQLPRGLEPGPRRRASRRPLEPCSHSGDAASSRLSIRTRAT